MNLQKGKLLVAEPYMLDPNFRRGVVLLCDHQKDGSFGFILNKPIEMNISDLLSSFPDFKCEVFYGGPVQTDTIHYLHTKGDMINDSIEVLDGVYWCADFEQIKDAIQYGQILPLEIRFYVGYSGWGEGQLVNEQSHFSWLTAEGESQFIFNDDWKNLWQKVLESQGGTYHIIGQMGQPQLN